MTITRVGSSKKFAEGWSTIFGGGKSAAPKKETAAKKKAAPKKKAAKKAKK